MRLKAAEGRPRVHLILETKGHDMRKEVKAQAVRRWVDAVNADGSYGVWEYAMVGSVGVIDVVLRQFSGRRSEVK